MNRWKWQRRGPSGSQLSRRRSVRSDGDELLAYVRPEGDVWIWAAQSGATGHWHRGWATTRVDATRDAEDVLNGEASSLSRVTAEIKALRDRAEALNRDLRGGA